MPTNHKISSSLWVRALLGLALSGGLASWAARVHAQEQALPGDRVAEIHDACSKAGLPVQSVRFNEGRYEVVMAAGAEGRRADAEAIKDQVLSRPKAVIVVDNVADALVVVRFEPNNASANAVLRARYEQLKTAASPR